MKASNVAKAVALALSVAWVAGCSSTGGTDTGTSGAVDTSGSSADSKGAAVSGGVSAAEMAAQKAADAVAALQTVFYFDFDKSVVRQDGLDALEKHAAYLVATPSAFVRLEGHADERGTREYNMALGERRANAVANYLIINGIERYRVETVSYGEERPVNSSSTDSAWAENRRVELK